MPEQWHIYFKNLKVAGEFKGKERRRKKSKKRGREKRSVEGRRQHQRATWLK